MDIFKELKETMIAWDVWHSDKLSNELSADNFKNGFFISPFFYNNAKRAKNASSNQYILLRVSFWDLLSEWGVADALDCFLKYHHLNERTYRINYSQIRNNFSFLCYFRLPYQPKLFPK